MELNKAIKNYADKKFWDTESKSITSEIFKKMVDEIKDLENSIKESKKGKSKILIKLGLGSKSLTIVKNIKKDLNNAYKLATKFTKKNTNKNLAGTMKSGDRDKLIKHIEDAISKVKELTEKDPDKLTKFLKAGKKNASSNETDYIKAVVNESQTQWEGLSKKMEKFKEQVKIITLKNEQ